MNGALIPVANSASPSGTPCAKPEHELFAQALADHGNRSGAYRLAYPHAAENPAALKVSAHRLAHHPDVQRRVMELEQQRRERILGADLELLVGNLTSGKATRLFDEDGNPIPVHLLPKDVQDAIAGLKLKVTRDKDGNTCTEYDVKLVDPLAALRLLAQLRGALVERHDVTSAGRAVAPAADQLTAAQRQRLNALLEGREKLTTTVTETDTAPAACAAPAASPSPRGGSPASPAPDDGADLI